ncbi:MAG: hypothetical protein AB7G47_19610 [Mycolicibacterium sp.]|uniref:hypothetical protein n=1 Tax=Mycolicibacterium sp. TaxID=2320850 RepID=UPI003D0B6053
MTAAHTRRISDSEWRSLASWYTADLTADQVAHYLDESGDTLVADFFAAQHSAYDQRWSLADIYSVMLSQHPDRAEYRIPRLYPFTTPTGPARLLHTQPARIDELQADFVVHAWDPRDDRGPIAIAYPVRDCPSAMTPEAATALLGALTWASAVAVLSGQDVTKRFDKTQPGVWVADGTVPDRRHGVRITTDHHPWGDLANLLRITLPWWPASLRDRDAMLAWRPGDETRQLRPATTDCNPDALRRLHTADSSDTLRRTIDTAATNAEHSLACTHLTRLGYTDDYTENAGLTTAATTDRHRDTKPLTAGEAALILHQPAPDHATAWACTAVLRGISVAHDLYTVTAELAQHPLAQAWLAQLTLADQPQELGFYLPAARMANNADPVYCLTHPRWPDCWALRQGSTTFLTVGTSVPASGRLTELHIAAGAAFFRESTGAVWPLPLPHQSRTPHRIAAAITQLMLDAGADVDDLEQDIQPTQDLLDILENQPLPITITANRP